MLKTKLVSKFIDVIENAVGKWASQVFGACVVQFGAIQ